MRPTEPVPIYIYVEDEEVVVVVLKRLDYLLIVATPNRGIL